MQTVRYELDKPIVPIRYLRRLVEYQYNVLVDGKELSAVVASNILAGHNPFGNVDFVILDSDEETITFEEPVVLVFGKKKEAYYNPNERNPLNLVNFINTITAITVKPTSMQDVVKVELSLQSKVYVVHPGDQLFTYMFQKYLVTTFASDCNRTAVNVSRLSQSGHIYNKAHSKPMF